MAISFVIAAINAMLVFLLRMFKFNVEKHWTTTGTELRWVVWVRSRCGVRCGGHYGLCINVCVEHWTTTGTELRWVVWARCRCGRQAAEPGVVPSVR